MVGNPPEGIPQEQYYRNVPEEVSAKLYTSGEEAHPQEESEPQQEASEPVEEEEPKEEDEDPQNMKGEESEPIDVEEEGEEEPFGMFPEFAEFENKANEESDYYAPTNERSDFYALSPIMVPTTSTMTSENFGRIGPSEPAW
ncbi:histone chaperone ASF1-like [Lycium ferocissimum]|uniref:histone chaperone ASF1-like n=1 Tax=Lycium ferocissimum TaxID=112874 RepID=UPI0028155628|nr:histone chaperone ASF1-like [Lycium ferocissimum]